MNMTLLFFWAFMAYGMTTIIVYGSIFDKPREFIKRHSKFFGDLVGCMLCTSTWCGFFLSLVLGGLSTKIFDINWIPAIFFDGMYTAGIVWAINGIVEFFEESRIK
jgi:hypothetical protein